MSVPDPITAERTLRARQAAHRSWANTTDRTRRTAAARAAVLDRIDATVDPGHLMDPATKAKAITNARKAHFTELARKSAAARRRGDRR